METSQLYFYEDLEVGTAREKEYVITPAVYADFLRVFGDRGPLHLTGHYPQACGFVGTVMHGAILNGCLSNFIGMILPGGRSLELSVEIRYSQPVYVGNTLELQGKIVQKLDVQKVVVLHFIFVNLTRGNTAATGRVQVKMMTV